MAIPGEGQINHKYQIPTGLVLKLGNCNLFVSCSLLLGI